jgi:hypothetical protein
MNSIDLATAFTAFRSSNSQHLRVRSWNSAAGVVLSIAGLTANMDGSLTPFVYTSTPNTDRSAKTDIFPLGDAVLVACQVVPAAGTPLRGQCFVRVELIQGREGAVQPLATLLQGYVTAGMSRSYPGSPLEDSLSGPGFFRTVTGTDPAAGIQIIETVPAGARWRLAGFQAVITTSAVVAARVPSLIIDDGAVIAWQIGTSQAIAASLSAGFTWGDGAGAFGGTSAGNLGMLPRDMRLPAGYRFRTAVALFDAGDNWAAPTYGVEEWIEA